MKRLVVALSIIALGMFSPWLVILAQPLHTPHEDPASATVSLDKATLLLSYGNMLNLAASKQYEGAQAMLNDLKCAEIPAELRYIFDRYNTLCQQLIATLDSLDSFLNEASALLSRNQLGDARQRLDSAEADVREASSLLEEINDASTALGDRLGVFAAYLQSDIKRAYDRLAQSEEQLRQLINELSRLRQSLTDKYETQASLVPAELSINIIPESVFVGDIVTVSGRLSAGGSPLPRREIALFLDKNPFLINTGPDGSYVANIGIPYKYVSSMTLYAEYLPTGKDIDTYQASRSPPVVINTGFYSTTLEITAPATAYPGLPVTVSGQVSSTGGSAERTIRILAGDTRLAEATIPTRFSLELELPPQISTGNLTLTAVVVPQWRYSGASEDLTVGISRLPVQADIQVPRLAAIPGTIEISGKVYYNLGPVQDASIGLNFGNSSATVRTSADGAFTAPVHLPFDLSLISPREVTVVIEPVEPRYAALEVKRRIFTINPVNIGLVLAGLILLGALAYKRTRPARPGREDIIPPPQVRELAFTPMPGPRREVTGIKGRVLSAYTRGLKAVQKATRIPVTPHTTFREFLQDASSLLPAAVTPFTELTAMAEMALYSTYDLGEDMAVRGDRLAAAIIEELHGGIT